MKLTKIILATLLLQTLCSLAVERSVTSFPLVTGANIEPANDSILFLDASANPQGARVKFSELVNVPSLFSGYATTSALTSGLAGKETAGAAAAAQAAAISTASTDATTKANAAQAAAIQRGNHTGTQPLSSLATTGATEGQVVKLVSGAWVPGAVSGGVTPSGTGLASVTSGVWDAPTTLAARLAADAAANRTALNAPGLTGGNNFTGHQTISSGNLVLNGDLGFGISANLRGAAGAPLVILPGSGGTLSLVDPALGTPVSGIATNLTGTAAGLTAGNASAALGLKTATTTVSLSSATAPTAGQVLTATGATGATWQPPASGGGSYITLSDSATVNLPSVNTALASALAGKETALGNPTVSGRILSSTTGGVRSWVDPAGLRYVKNIKRRVCGTQGFLLNSPTATLGVQSRTCSFEVKTTDNVTDPQWVWFNSPAGNSVTIKASVVLGTQIIPLSFNGTRTITLAPGCYATSDSLGIAIPKNTIVGTRTFADAGSGNVIKTNRLGTFGAAATSSYWDSTDVVDSASPGTATSTSGGHVFVPNYMIGKTDNPCLAILGDSITANGISPQPFGWVTESFGSSATQGMHQGALANTALLAEGGRTAYEIGVAPTTGSGGINYQRLALMQYADSAIVLLGTNDVVTRTDTQIIADLQAIYNSLSRLGISVTAVTIPPKSTSTDGFVTTINQTPNSGQMTKINAVNAWIRTTPTPCVGYVDISDVLSSSRDSGIWKANYTADGTHPAATAITAMVAAVPSGLIDR